MDSVVATRSGSLRGRRVGRVRVFEGIPYARPLDSARRFEAPEPGDPWQGVRDAQSPGPASPQAAPVTPVIRQLIGPGGRMGVDCLYLNVTTPKCDDRRRPVMVWIHGGAFVLGTGSAWIYAGDRLALRGDVVVVTLNYRLGALGSINHPAARDAGIVPNLGLRDQIAALEWVRDHIDAFGGDPENVTIFGESAGGMSVGTLLGTPRAAGLFHRAICQSGAAHNVSTAAYAADVAEILFRSLGHEPDDARFLLDVSQEALLEGQRKTTLELGLALGILTWQPSVDGDVLPELPLDAVAKGLSSTVPLLVGTNRDEWRLFMLGDRKARGMDDAALLRRLERALPGHAKDALDTYRGFDRPFASPAALWESFQSDRVFHHPAQRLAEARAAQAGATYGYLFDWQPPLVGDRIGACHGIEIPFVFGTLLDVRLRFLVGALPGARRLSRRMQDAWVAFARNGSPECDDVADWPVWNGGGRRSMRLGSRCGAETARFRDAYDFWEAHI